MNTFLIEEISFKANANPSLIEKELHEGDLKKLSENREIQMKSRII